MADKKRLWQAISRRGSSVEPRLAICRMLMEAKAVRLGDAYSILGNDIFPPQENGPIEAMRKRGVSHKDLNPA